MRERAPPTRCTHALLSAARSSTGLATVFDVLTIMSTPSQCSTFAALDILATLYAAIIDAANSASSRPLPGLVLAVHCASCRYAERGFAASVC